MEKRGKELSKAIEEEFNGLEILSYEQMVELLNDQGKHIMIWFSEYKDSLFTGNEYHYVQVRDLGNDKHKTYRAPDQDDELIERNLSSAIDKSSIEGKYAYYDGDWRCDFFCTIGKNTISFPISVAKRTIREFHESAQRQAEFEKQKQAKTIVLKPKTVDPGELPFEI